MTTPIITVENLSKRYHLGQIGATTLRDSAQRLWHRLRGQNPDHALGKDSSLSSSDSGFKSQTLTSPTSPTDFWALKDVSFEVQPGEVLGIIGRNGAGKSTLLKILARITEPTSGRAIIRGRMASLLEVGTGFHPELSGRENIFLNGAILGMRHAEIAQKFDEIVAFSEVDQFIDTPVKHYSSGMYVRLAFAVAAHLDPEILVVDEVLAVGDIQFQKKCLSKMGDIAQEGRTVLFVSHNMGAVSTLTTRSLWLSQGRIVESGGTFQVVKHYLANGVDVRDRQVGDLDFFRRDRSHKNILHIKRIWVKGEVSTVPIMEINADFTLCVEVEVHQAICGANVTVVFKNEEGSRVLVLFSWDEGFSLTSKPGLCHIGIGVRGLPLSPGQYVVDVGINQSTVTIAFDVVTDVPVFTIVNSEKVTQWPDRTWGCIHWSDVKWDNL